MEKVVFKGQEYITKYKKNGQIILTPVDEHTVIEVKTPLSEYSYNDLWNEIMNRNDVVDHNEVIIGAEEGIPFFEDGR